MPQQLEAPMVQQVFDVASRAREKVIDAKHFMSPLEEFLAQMRAKKSCAARDENSTVGVSQWTIPGEGAARNNRGERSGVS